MKIVRPLKAMLFAVVLSASLLVLAACSGGTDGVAATVNGQDISEQTVTDQVQHNRAQSGLSENQQWGRYLVQNDLTPEKVRENAINVLVEKHLIKEACGDLEIAVEESEVDEAVSAFRENFQSDESWNNALEQAGFTEESYRRDIDSSLVQKKVGEYFDGQAEVTEEDYVNAAKTYASYYDGAKRTSQIFFAATGDEESSPEAALEEAQSVLAQINAGTLDFDAAARQYSDTEGAAENGGDAGWDKLNTWSSDITTAISEMEAGAVSEPISTGDGVYLVQVTEVYDAPEADAITSLDQVPEAFRENIRSMATSIKANTLYTDWFAEVKESAEIDIKPMPKGLPYDIDLAPYEKEQEEKEAAASADAADPAADTATDPAADTTTDATTDAGSDVLPVDGAATDGTSDAGTIAPATDGDATTDGGATDGATGADGTAGAGAGAATDASSGSASE